MIVKNAFRVEMPHSGYHPEYIKGFMCGVRSCENNAAKFLEDMAREMESVIESGNMCHNANNWARLWIRHIRKTAEQTT